MIIKPRIKGFLCTTAHPIGCEEDVKRQIEHVRSRGKIDRGPERVLIIGASGGYGLASRITAAFGCDASTIGVFFERPAMKNRTASPGWYKSAAFSRQAEEAGIYAKNVNGDAFSKVIKDEVINLIKRDLGQVDMVIYSLAAPARQLPDGTVVRSVLKPIGETFEGSTIDLNSRELKPVTLEPATQEEIDNTVKVMGGEDWELWMQALREAGVLANGCISTNYTYLGSEITWPIYHHGTIGKAKEDLDRAANALQEDLGTVNGEALVCVMKGVVTQAAAAIPGMSIYLSLLFKVMKELGTHEGCIEQTTRLFHTSLFSDASRNVDDMGRVRMDDLELSDEAQDYVKNNWSRVNAENLSEIADFQGYRRAFLQMHGFEIDDVDYDADVDPAMDMPIAYESVD